MEKLELIKKYINAIKRGEGVMIDSGIASEMREAYYSQYKQHPCFSCDGDKIRALEILIKRYDIRNKHTR